MLAALYNGALEDAAQVLNDYPGEMDARLKKLIGQILRSCLPAWREAASVQRVSLPKFVDSDWRVEMQSSSSAVLQMATPSVLLNLRVQDQPSCVGELPAERNLTFEMSRETLQTLLDGFGKIRDQLSAVAKPN